MASLSAIQTKTAILIDRLIAVMGPALVLPPHKRFIPEAHAFRTMEIIEAMVEAMEAKDPPGTPTAELPDLEPGEARPAEKALVTA